LCSFTVVVPDTLHEDDVGVCRCNFSAMNVQILHGRAMCCQVRAGYFNIEGFHLYFVFLLPVLLALVSVGGTQTQKVMSRTPVHQSGFRNMNHHESQRQEANDPRVTAALRMLPPSGPTGFYKLVNNLGGGGVKDSL